MIIGKSFKFDAAHFLPNYDGPCSRMHGHTWKVEVEVEGDVDKKTGMVLDLRLLSEIVAPLVLSLDHNLLNEVLPPFLPPTCENLCALFKSLVTAVLDAEENVIKISIKVQEGEGGWARTI